ncbi:MAG: HAD family hydrolase [Candidatus Hodarchaeota archaeon]
MITFSVPNGRDKFLREIKKHDVSLILASNQVFPLVEVEKRLAFEDLPKEIFSFITTGENSRFAKHNPGYYRNIAKSLKIPTTECLMVGNDLKNDIVPAQEVGMQTFLLIEKNERN